ncbi:MAG: YIP1 family protein [bacterium]|nr:YIP1 family protein [bacterium]
MELIYHFLFDPVSSIREIKKVRPCLLAGSIVILATVSGTIGNLLVTGLAPDIAKISLTLGLVIKLISIFLLWLIFTSILHFIAEGLKGEGEVSSLFISLGFSFIPGILLTPLALISHIFGPLKVFIYLLFGVIILIWIVILQVLALKETYQLSYGKACLAFVIPICIGGISLFVLGILSLLTLISFIDSLLSF